MHEARLHCEPKRLQITALTTNDEILVFSQVLEAIRCKQHFDAIFWCLEPAQPVSTNVQRTLPLLNALPLLPFSKMIIWNVKQHQQNSLNWFILWVNTNYSYPQFFRTAQQNITCPVSQGKRLLWVAHAGHSTPPFLSSWRLSPFLLKFNGNSGVSGGSPFLQIPWKKQATWEDPISIWSKAESPAG